MRKMDEMCVWKEAEGSYKVSSESEEGRYYRVREARDVWVCSCPHFTENHTVEECKHIRRVKEALSLNDDDEGRVIDQTPLARAIDELSRIFVRLRIVIDKLNDIKDSRR